MDLKSAINIILRDLKEAGDLIEDLGNKPDFPRLQIELAKSKCKSAEELIRLIGEIISEYQPGDSKLTHPQPQQEPEEQQEEPQQLQGEPEKTQQEKSQQLQGEPEEEYQQQALEEIHRQPQQEEPGLFDNDILDLEEELEEITEPGDQHDETAGADKHKESITGETVDKDSAEPGQEKKSDRIVADRFSHLSSSINEKVGESKKSEGKPRSMPVTDLNRALGINDRFYFIRELFNGNEDSFRETIDRLNKAASKEEATSILSESVK
ncbi:MAG: hypothetical protein V2I34_00740, partial [Bacteroidales bacterium]|nr:hypothetical protein [Bacteroidales bacterium]